MPSTTENKIIYGLKLDWLTARFNTHRSTILIIILSLIISGIFLSSGGSIFAVVAIIFLVLAVMITLYRVDWGFILFIGMVLIFDQFPPRGYGITIIGTEYFGNLKSLPLFSKIDAAVLNPLELQLLLIGTVWIVMIVLGKNVQLNRVPVWFTALLFFGWLIISAIYGLARGGDFLPALWELRALFYMGVIYFFIPQIIQSREQLRLLIWVVIGALAFKAMQGGIRAVRLGFSFGSRTELTNHEDPLFFVSLFILLFGMILFRSDDKQKKILYWLLLPMLGIFILSQRRATYAALGFSLITFMILLPKIQRAKLLKKMFPVAIAGVLYLAIFWNSESSIALPAQLVKSSISSDHETAGDRYYSNLYRDFENYNLAQTVKRSPVIGIGFGNKYDQPIALPKIPFPLRDYIPHNEIYWLIVKMGVIGFFLFWLFINSYVMSATYTFMRLKDPYLKAICAVAIIAIVGQIVVSFVDLQLTFYRNMVYLGMIMGLLSTIERLDTTESSTKILKQLSDK